MFSKRELYCLLNTFRWLFIYLRMTVAWKIRSSRFCLFLPINDKRSICSACNWSVTDILKNEILYDSLERPCSLLTKDKYSPQENVRISSSSWILLLVEIRQLISIFLLVPVPVLHVIFRLVHPIQLIWSINCASMIQIIAFRLFKPYDIRILMLFGKYHINQERKIFILFTELKKTLNYKNITISN